MTFTLSGFTDGKGMRRFAFEGLRGDHSRSVVIVDADVNLARKHDIRLQELPLICLRLLESFGADEPAQAITLTEDRMIVVQEEARNAAEKKTRKAPRRAAPAPGQAWRNPSTLIRQL